MNKQENPGNRRMLAFREKTGRAFLAPKRYLGAGTLDERMEIHRQYLLVRPRAEVPGVRICRATRLVYNKDGIQKMRRGHLFKWEESKHPHWKVTHMCSKCERRNARFPNDSKDGKMRIRIHISNFLKTDTSILSLNQMSWMPKTCRTWKQWQILLRSVLCCI